MQPTASRRPILLLSFSLLLLGLLPGCNTYVGRFFLVNKPTVTTDKYFKAVPIPQLPAAAQLPYPSVENIAMPDIASWASYRDGTVPASLEELAEKTGMVALLIMQDGKLVYERYFNGNAADSLQLTFSLTKSYVATLVGMAIDRGYIPSLDVPVAKYLPEFRTPEKEGITLRHLITMTSGLAQDDYGSVYKLGKIFCGRDHRKFVTGLPPAYPPGTYFAYKSTDTQLLGLCLEAAVGRPAPELLQEWIRKPLGMQDKARWLTDDHGSPKFYGGLCATPRDHLRFGEFLWRQGAWQGEQLVPQPWMARAQQRDTSGGAWMWYSYSFWQGTFHRRAALAGNRDFFASGLNGQIIYVNPETNTVIVRVGRRYGDFIWGRAISRLAYALNPNKQPNESCPLPRALAGRYVSPQGDTMRVTFNERGYMQLSDKRWRKLKLQPDNSCYYRDMHNDYRAVLDASPEQPVLFLDSYDQRWTFRRLAPSGEMSANLPATKPEAGNTR